MRYGRTKIVALLAMAAAAAGCGDEEEGSAAAAPNRASAGPAIEVEAPAAVGKLAFTTAGLQPDVYVVEPGGEPRNVTGDEAEQQDVAWSPDGTRIAFASFRDGSYDIVVANADGSGARPITDLPADERNPTWSPDGKSLAFAVEGPGENFAVYVIGAGGGQVRKLVQEEKCFVGDPRWSNDGRAVAVAVGGLIPDGGGAPDPDCISGGDIDIFLADIDTGSLEQLTRGRSDETRADWSPDGSRLAIVDHAGPALLTIRADGRGRRRIGPKLASPDARPEWSPDGSSILYVDEGGSDIYMVHAKGGKPRTITQDVAITSISAVAP